MPLSVDNFRCHVFHGAAEGVGLVFESFFGETEVGDGNVTARIL